MGIERLWPLLLVVFIPGIILLYLLKQKVINQKISALNLWKEAYENIQSSTPWEKFRNNILMYMQITALILVIIAMLSPYITGSGSEYSNVLIMIDNSASMSGMYSENATKLETAKKQAVDYVNTNNDGVRYTVMTTGDTSSLEISGSDDKRRVMEAVNNIEATDIAGSLEAGISMAKSLISAWDSYKVIAFTDSSANVQNINCEVVDLSVQGDNGAVQSLSHTVSEDGTVKVMARVDNYGKNQLHSDVNLYIGKKLYDIQNVAVEAGGSSVVYFKNIPSSRFTSALTGSTPYLMAELNAKDMLKGDNTIYDILEGDNAEKILLVTEKNTFLEKALKLSGNKTVDKVTPKDTNAVKTEEYSLIVYDSVLPEELPDTGNVIFINPSVAGLGNDKKESAGWQQEIFHISETKGKKKKKNRTSVIKAVKCDVTEYIEDYSFSSLDVTEFQTPEWAFSFFNTGRNLSVGYFGNFDGRMVAVTGFDLHNTDFPLQTEFPIFMYNLLRKMLSARITERTVYNAGEAVGIQKKGKAEKAVVTKPDGTKEEYSLDNGTAVCSETLNAGLYDIMEGDDRIYFTVSFPEEESDVLKEAVITSDKNIKPDINKKLSGNVSKRMVTMPVLALLLILLMAEWRLYRKRL